MQQLNLKFLDAPVQSPEVAFVEKAVAVFERTRAWVAEARAVDLDVMLPESDAALVRDVALASILRTSLTPESRDLLDRMLCALDATRDALPLHDSEIPSRAEVLVGLAQDLRGVIEAVDAALDLEAALQIRHVLSEARRAASGEKAG